jgi:hypothetical protein
MKLRLNASRRTTSVSRLNVELVARDNPGRRCLRPWVRDSTLLNEQNGAEGSDPRRFYRTCSRERPLEDSAQDELEKLLFRAGRQNGDPHESLEISPLINSAVSLNPHPVIPDGLQFGEIVGGAS